ncbi:MAG: hypothetical protein U5L11_09115 [Arhodomonas sp.]|nr:hypothetical protein [Arhodomonas sp.]
MEAETSRIASLSSLMLPSAQNTAEEAAPCWLLREISPGRSQSGRIITEAELAT